MKYFTLLTLLALLFGVSTNASAQTLPIFTEGYGSGISFAAFGGSTNNVTDDATVAYTGTHSLKIVMPAGGYTGGALIGAAQDLSTYNAVSFWIKGTTTETLDKAGISNNAASATFQTEFLNIPVTTTWTKIVIPIPNPSKLTAETGLFHFAEGAGSYTIWMDDIQYETTTVGAATASMATATITKSIGDSFTPTGATCTIGGTPLSITAACFTYTSSNTGVATMNNATGTGTAVAGGTTNITATMGATVVSGTLTVNVTAAPSGPTAAAATPTKLAANVISLFSNAYTNVPVERWSTTWGIGALEDIAIGGNATKKYTGLTYTGIDFSAPVIDGTTMTGFHMDIWTPDAAEFKVKIRDFGANGTYDGGDDAESAEISISPTANTWTAFDLPLTAFTGLTTKAHLGQMVIVTPGGGKTVYVDNVYFYKEPVVASTEPTTAAPTPTKLPANVTSLFSNAYTNVGVDTWSAPWDAADVEDVTIAGNATKKYTNHTFSGIEFVGPNLIDATSKTHFHLDVWTANAAGMDGFKVKFRDFGANGVYDAAGDDAESIELPFTPTASGWYAVDVPLSSFTGLTTKAHLAQMLLVTPGGGKTFWIDNVYFYNEPPTTPTTAATAPTRPQANVISLYSDTYTNVAGTFWNQYNGGTVYTTMAIAGNATQKYTGMGYSVAQLAAPINTVNATHLHLDVWAPTAIAAGVFRVKLVDYGADGTGFGPADNTEGEVTNLPAIPAGTWTALDIPLADFMAASPALGSTAHLAQFIPSGGGTVFMDNIYFYAATALTVELTTVKAKAVNTTTVLTWQTASEKDNAGFTIERSTDATTFTAIGNVKGNGTTNAASDYTFTDATPLTGVNYYRLRQADFNGKESLSKVVSVAFGKNVLVLKNTLVQNTLEVIVSESEKTPLSIFNVSGQLVFSAKVQGTQVLDVSNLTAGVYIVRMGTGEARRFVKN